MQGQGRPPAAAELRPQGWEGTSTEATGTATGCAVWEQRFVVLSPRRYLEYKKGPNSSPPSMSSSGVCACHETSKMRVLRFIAQVKAEPVFWLHLPIPGLCLGPGLLTPFVQ